jgi:hypothetical protein
LVISATASGTVIMTVVKPVYRPLQELSSICFSSCPLKCYDTCKPIYQLFWQLAAEIVHSCQIHQASISAAKQDAVTTAVKPIRHPFRELTKTQSRQLSSLSGIHFGSWPRRSHDSCLAYQASISEAD